MSVTEGTILKIVASFLFPDSVIAQNVFAAVLTTEGGSSDDTDVVSDMADWMEEVYTNLLAQISEDVSTTDVKVYKYDGIDEDFDEVGTKSWTVAFSDTNDMLPHGVAAVVHARCLDPDVQGTKYIGGIVETGISDSDWGGAILTALSNYLTDWITQFVGAATGATFTPVVWSPTAAVSKGLDGTGFINGQCGYQRRRKPGVGI